jgi:hypothetical protein
MAPKHLSRLQIRQRDRRDPEMRAMMVRHTPGKTTIIAVVATDICPPLQAKSMLKLCEFYLTSSPMYVALMTGSDLKKRIDAIMSNQVAMLPTRPAL